jgi:tetratricopeptide (TPR) repeat protein
MTSLKMKDQLIQNRSYSRAFKEGLQILTEELELAQQWNRPSILLAIQDSKTGRINTQQVLEQAIIKRNKQVVHITVEAANPDVIRVMSETPNSAEMVFFVSGMEIADQASDGRVYRALNIRRELLVERSICVVFWINELEASKLARLAPDFWAFRHRAVEFAPKYGSRKKPIPIGLFLWEEQIPWMRQDVQKNQLAYFEDMLMRLPNEDDAAVVRIETTLKLVHFSWLLNDPGKFAGYLEDGFALLEKYPIPQYHAWMLNAKAIGLYEEGNRKEASIHFAQALSHDPENSAIMMNAGIAVHGLGSNSKAILIGCQAIKKDQGNFQLQRVLGYLYLSTEKMDDALKALTKAQEMSPDSTEIHYSLAICYYKNDQFSECANELSIAKEFSPPENAIQLACVGILSGKKDEALAQLKFSLEKGEIGKHQIIRDPNLHFLLNSQEFPVNN